MNPKELRPSCIMNRLRQHAAGESLHVQIFYRNKAELIDQLAGFLVIEIRSLIEHLDVRPQKKPYCLAAAITAYWLRRATLRWQHRSRASAFR